MTHGGEVVRMFFFRFSGFNSLRFKLGFEHCSSVSHEAFTLDLARQSYKCSVNKKKSLTARLNWSVQQKCPQVEI